MYSNRTCFYERTPEEIAYHTAKSVYIKERDTQAIINIKIREDYAYTKPDTQVRYNV